MTVTILLCRGLSNVLKIKLKRKGSLKSMWIKVALQLILNSCYNLPVLAMLALGSNVRISALTQFSMDLTEVDPRGIAEEVKKISQISLTAKQMHSINLCRHSHSVWNHAWNTLFMYCTTVYYSVLQWVFSFWHLESCLNLG